MLRRRAAAAAAVNEEGIGEARGVPWALLGAERALLLLPPPLTPDFFGGAGATACFTLRTSVLTLNLDFWLNMLIATLCSFFLFLFRLSKNVGRYRRSAAASRLLLLVADGRVTRG